MFVEGKRGDRDCEDAIVASDDFVAVVDGATDETGASFAGRSGGRFAADVVVEAVKSMSPTITHREFADCLTRAMAEAVEEVIGPRSPGFRWPVASVACYAARLRQVWRIGDCHIRIGDVLHPGRKRVDDASYGFRAVINSALIAEGMPVEQVLRDDPGAEASRPLYDLQQYLANTTGPWGYGCINGVPVPDQHIDVLLVPPGPHRVVLATDGYPELLATLAESEARLFELMTSDPVAIGDLWSMGKCLKPGSRSMDDRAFVGIEVDA